MINLGQGAAASNRPGSRWPKSRTSWWSDWPTKSSASMIDRFLGQEEVVIKSLGRYLGTTEGVAGRHDSG